MMLALICLYCVVAISSQCIHPICPPKVESKTLNGSLRINEFSVPGSHNAGAYKSVLFLDCFVRSQTLRLAEQLQLGIRYFDIDLCYSHTDDTLLLCHTVNMDKLSEALNDVRCFVKQNPEEILFLHFNRDFKADEAKGFDAAKRFYDQIYSSIGDIVFPLREFYERNLRMPTVQEVWDSGSPVVVFLAGMILVGLAGKMTVYDASIEPEKTRLVGDASRFVSIAWLDIQTEKREGKLELVGKEFLMNEVRYRCMSSMPFIDLQIIGSWTTCYDELAKIINPLIPEVFEVCKRERCRNNRAVNFVTIDYIQNVPAALYGEISNNACSSSAVSNSSTLVRHC